MFCCSCVVTSLDFIFIACERLGLVAVELDWLTVGSYVLTVFLCCLGFFVVGFDDHSFVQAAARAHFAVEESARLKLRTRLFSPSVVRIVWYILSSYFCSQQSEVRSSYIRTGTVRALILVVVVVAVNG